jgi:hypothetical protein
MSEPGDWLYDELDTYFGIPDLLVGSDIDCAVRRAHAFYGEGRHAQAMLNRVAKWLDELFADMHFWSVVESLALQLIGVDRMDGSAALAVMEEAWGDRRPPFLTMGRTWRRRFGVSGPVRERKGGSPRGVAR